GRLDQEGVGQVQLLCGFAKSSLQYIVESLNLSQQRFLDGKRLPDSTEHPVELAGNVLEVGGADERSLARQISCLSASHGLQKLSDRFVDLQPDEQKED